MLARKTHSVSKDAEVKQDHRLLSGGRLSTRLLSNSSYRQTMTNYTAVGGHITDLSGGNELKVNGNASIGSANSVLLGALLVRGGTLATAHLTELNVDINTVELGKVRGSISIENR